MTVHMRLRLAAEGGFTMIVALGVLLVTALLTAAVFSAINSDTALSRADLNGKQAYAAAQAAVQTYLYELNNNATTSQWWETCANDYAGPAPAPGTTVGATYSYRPVLANGSVTCSTTDPVSSLIDTATGSLRLEFTGNAGGQSRTIVASFRTLSPLSFLWYTVHETVDPLALEAEGMSASNANQCNTFYWQYSGGATAPSYCQINWVTGDQMNGPMYTQDQLLINSGGSPTFGRSGSQDVIASQEPTPGNANMCVLANCQNATFQGIVEPAVSGSQRVNLPSDNANLLTDAQNHGVVLPGTTTLTINNGVATGYNCPGTTSSAPNCTPVSIDLASTPIFYATNASGCSSSYNPANVTYPQLNGGGSLNGMYYGPCGDVYIEGTYNVPVTIAAADDVILTGSLLNATDPRGTNPALTGPATLGLVANMYVRVAHTCQGWSALPTPTMTIDAAILTLQHSFYVDNYDCGARNAPNLTVHGAIAQFYRGIVGTTNGYGYIKDYWYDNRLQLILPPYLFDLQNTEWSVFRQTLCGSAASGGAAC